MKIKWDRTCATVNVHYRGSPVRKSNSATRVLLTLCTFQQHVESHLGKNQMQPKILIAFLFSQLHFNNVTFCWHALFHGGHLVMRGNRCAVQNQRMQQKLAELENSPVRSSPRQVDFLAGRGNCPYEGKKWPQARKCESCLPIGQAWIYPWDKPAGIFKFSSSPAPCAA